MRETCDAGAASGTGVRAGSVMAFQPMVDPSSGVTETEADVRRGLLRRASVNDHAYAVQAVVRQYNEYLETKTATQRKILSSEAPAKFSASKYYASLRERIGEPGGEEPKRSRDTVRAVVGQQPLAPCPSPSSALSGIDLILSGKAFGPATTASEELVHKSALAILQSPDDGGR